MIREIRRLDSVLDGFILGSEDYLELVEDAYADNIHWSTKIEGNDLSLDEVRELTRWFSKGVSMEIDTGPRQEILNHLYSFFIKKEMSLPWDENVPRNVHSLLMKDVSDDVTPGGYRTEEVSVVGSGGFEYFRACPTKYIEEEMRSLIDWVNRSPYDEIITSALFFHEFESIHPFKDGNGRTGRTLFQILMQELGLRNCKLCKFEKEMLSELGTYYELLAYTDSTGQYTPLVMYVTESLLRAYENAVSEFGEKDRLADMDENTRVLVRRAKEVGMFSFKDACGWMPGMGSQTLRIKLDGLVDMDILEKRGNTRSMRYHFKDPLRNIREKVEIGSMM